MDWESIGRTDFPHDASQGLIETKVCVQCGRTFEVCGPANVCQECLGDYWERMSLLWGDWVPGCGEPPPSDNPVLNVAGPCDEEPGGYWQSVEDAH